MALYDCFFWYPTIYHQELKELPFQPHTIEVDISDDENSKETVKKHIITITRNAKDLIIKSNVLDIELQLICQDNRRNGFVLYTFDSTNIPEEFIEKFNKILEKDIYHAAKAFYHKHEANLKDKDSALRAIIIACENEEKKVKIDDDDNEILIRFLEDYMSVFQSYVRDISSANSLIQEIESTIKMIEQAIKDRKISDTNDIKRTLKAYKEFLLDLLIKMTKMSENALIEYTYYRTLLDSRYNKSFHHTSVINITDTKYEEKNEWRKKALNIRNAIRYIENIKYKNQNRYQALWVTVNKSTEEIVLLTANVNKILEESKKTETISKTLTWLGLVLSCIFGIPTLIETFSQNHLSFYSIWKWIIFGICIGFFLRIIYLYNENPKNKKYRKNEKD